jgi:peptide-methionine (S)-S-oxide reductase
MNDVCDIPGASLRVDRPQFPDPAFDPPADAGVREEVAVLAGGCFWCVEAVLRELDGVLTVASGYSGGDAASANYERVCSGATDHAEAVEVHFDPQRLSFGRLLKVFFSVAHDPTQVDRQGNDRGRQYRSAIFFVDGRQREVAQAYIRQLDATGVFTAPIATQVVPLEAFHRAEDHHQDYAARNPAQPYIAAVAAPKVAKLRERFGELLKDGLRAGAGRGRQA